MLLCFKVLYVLYGWAQSWWSSSSLLTLPWHNDEYDVFLGRSCTEPRGSPMALFLLIAYQVSVIMH